MESVAGFARLLLGQFRLLHRDGVSSCWPIGRSWPCRTNTTADPQAAQTRMGRMLSPNPVLAATPVPMKTLVSSTSSVPFLPLDSVHPPDEFRDLGYRARVEHAVDDSFWRPVGAGA